MIYLLYVPILLARAVYSLLNLLPPQDLVVLINRAPRGQDSPELELLKEQLQQQSADTQVTILHHSSRNILINIIYFAQQIIVMSRARAIVVERYVPAVGILNHRPKTNIIQIWHTLGAIKKFGWAAANTPEGLSTNLMNVMGVHRNYTRVVVPSKAMVEPYKAAFGVDDDTLVELNHPKQQLLQGYKKSQKRKKATTTKILYSPTYRSGNSDYIGQFIAATKDLDTSFQIDVIIHPLDNKNLSSLPKRYHRKSPTNFIEALTSYDLLITDYSASVFEAGVIDLPILLFRPDKPQYEADRGLFKDSKHLAKAEVTSPEELFDRIKNKDYSSVPIAKQAPAKDSGRRLAEAILL